MSELGAWGNFYLIVGTAAGALIGLQFVVITLIAQKPIRRVGVAVGAFSTPNIVHFEIVLVVSAVLCAPWRDVPPAAAACGVIGLVGLLYSVIVVRRMRQQSVYRPDLEDWVFFAVLPIAAYALLVIAACSGQSQPQPALCLVGLATLLLLFVGIHNTWDSVAYHVSQRDGS